MANFFNYAWEIKIILVLLHIFFRPSACLQVLLVVSDCACARVCVCVCVFACVLVAVCAHFVRVNYRDVLMHSLFSYPRAIDDNFFQHLRSIHKCAIKYVQKYFFSGSLGGGNHVNGFWLYFMACSCSCCSCCCCCWPFPSLLLLLFCLLPMPCTVASSIMLIKALCVEGGGG